jgi:protein-tyrosine phosphatase
MPHVLDWHGAAEPRELVYRAIQALAGGHLVAFPTETVYGLAASALAPDTVERLHQIRGGAEDRPLRLALRGPGEALDWAPGLSPLGRRLARRCWPGPVTLVCGDGVERGLVGRLPETVRRRVCPAGTIGLRTPAHAAVQRTLRLVAGPVVLSSAARGDGPAAVTAEQVVESFGEEVAVVLDGGLCRFGQPSTVVQVNGSHWSVLREGVVPAALVERQTACLIVFVCTGNTCRSPLAEALCKKLLAERLACAAEELPRRGFQVLSAGIAAMMEGPAAEEAVAVAGEFGADLQGHRSRPLTADLVAQADYLIAMTHSHLLAVADQYRHLGPRPRLLSPEGEDVADPIGCDQQVYQECAAQLWRHLQRFVAELPAE